MEQSTEQQIPIKSAALLTVKQFSQKHDWPMGGLRHLLFHQPNGFERVVRRVGRKILLNETEFFHWVEEINSKGGAR